MGNGQASYNVEEQERRAPAPAVRESTDSADQGVEHEVEAKYKYREHRSPSGDHVIQESTYSFTVRDKCIPGPPPSLRRRRSSLLNYVGQKLGGNFTREPEDMVDHSQEGPVCTLSPATQKKLQEIFQDLDPREIVDYHVHLVGHGDSGSGCYLHGATKSWWYPYYRIKTAVFMSAAQVPDMEGGDMQYISRLVRLINHFCPANVLNPSEHGYVHGKYCLLPFDDFYDKDGRKNKANTSMYVPNDYAFSCGRDFPELFHSFGSVNPYRPDALEELERCAKNGVTVIKWLPNSMGIDPSDKQCIPFYRKMKELDMALLVHAGEEHSVDIAFLDNRLGNPLLLKRPLECGVKVIAAHCATEGHAADLENNNVPVPCFDLFLRLMRDERYKDLLFGDISAVCAFKRLQHLRDLLEAKDIHDRLVYGSDYPVPAINLVVHTSKMKRYGLITQEDCSVLNELYNFNPLLFDVACKRLVRGSNGEKFPPGVFKAHPKLPPFNLGAVLSPDDATCEDTPNVNSSSMDSPNQPELSGDPGSSGVSFPDSGTQTYVESLD